MLCLLFLAVATTLTGHANPVPAPPSAMQGTGLAPSPHVSIGAITPTPVSTPASGITSVNQAGCVQPTRCGNNIIFVGPVGVVPTTYQNYVVVSPGVTTVTSATSDNSTYYVPGQQPPQIIYMPAPQPAAPPMPTVVLDAKGFVHSPYTASTFKVANLSNGQIVHDPSTGQAFRVLTVAPTRAAVVANSKFD